MRRSTWPANLSEYLAGCREKPFAYGEHDCCTFAAGAVEAMTGVDPIPEFRGKYTTELGSLKALKKYGAGTLEATIDGKFEVIPTGQARRGDLILFDGSVGVSVGRFAWFASDDGLERVPMSLWEKAWRVG